MLFHLFFFECYGDHRDLHGRTHSFPTRRSADLRTADLERSSLERDARGSSSVVPHLGAAHRRGRSSLPPLLPGNRRRIDQIASRSEEHTSELQSLMRTSSAVFCLNKKCT